MNTLNFIQLAREIASDPTETILQSARRHGVRIVGACGGRGTCGSCAVRVVDGEIVAVHPEGVAGSASPIETDQWVRACRVCATSDCTIEIEPRSLAPVVRADAADAAPVALDVDPLITARDVETPAATLADPLSDVDRLLRTLGSPIARVDLAAARELPALLRGHRWAVRVRARGDELIGFAAPGAPSLGLAVDLGTTNAAAFLIDLDSGTRLASLGIENPQVAWGADLITRINHAARSAQAAEDLRRAAVSAIDALAQDLCAATDVRTGDIVDAAVCANTAMHHLLLGLPVGQLGRTPFVAAVREAVDVKARELGLSFCPGAQVHVAPNVGGFVGGDHVAALLATETHWSDGATTLVMDIGTNTEITLIHDGCFLSASCPSGPALEGGHIRSGMRAAEGAIERVRIDASSGEIVLQVIGESTPIGLCGSGVLDALAALHAAGIVDDSGRLVRGHRHVHVLAGKPAARLAPGVLFTQDDVRSVQLAKAAIRTGVELLARRAQLRCEDIDRFVIGGAFGAYLDVDSGVAVGLFPDLPRARFVQVGNAAGVGVRQMLVSRRARLQAAELATRCRYVELSTIAEFQKTFLQHIGFTGTGARQTRARQPSLAGRDVA